MPGLCIWATPRSRSTALERSFIQHPSSTVHHETLTSSAGGASPDPDALLQAHMEREKEADFYVCKELTCYLPPRSPSMSRFLRSFTHVILVRDPYPAIASLKKCGLEGGGVAYYDPGENGVEEAFRLKGMVRRETGVVPLCIDADRDLMRDPEGTVREICKRAGVQFAEEMMTWESGPVQQFEKLKGWHDDAEKSTGFVKQDQKKVKYIDDEDVVKAARGVWRSYVAVLDGERTAVGLPYGSVLKMQVAALALAVCASLQG